MAAAVLGAAVVASFGWHGEPALRQGAWCYPGEIEPPVVKSRGDLLDLEHQKDRLGQNPSNYMLFNIYICTYIYVYI